MKSTNKVFLLLFILLGIISCKQPDDMPDPELPKEPIIETFTFAPGGINKGKIYLPSSYDTLDDLPVIFLIDFEEQHFEVAKDEFQQVINGINLLLDFDAVIVTLGEHLDIATQVVTSQEYFNLFKDLASYVDTNYAVSSSKTIIGRGSEGGVVLLSLFQESGESHGFKNFIATDPPSEFIYYISSLMESDTFPQDKSDMKLHYSFSDNYELAANTAMINKITEKNYSWLTFASKPYPNLSFEEAYPQAYADGLSFIFR